MKKVIVSFKDFSFKYQAQQTQTLKSINLDIYEGEKVLILGASGSGKSTLGYCINGLIPNRFKGEIEGSCEVMGENISHTSIFELSKHVGTILQDSDAQFVGLSVAEDIAFALENKNESWESMKNLVDAAALKVGVTHQLDTLPYSLSGGQKQRVSVAGLLHENVEILLLDEPLASLDPKMGQVMIEIVDELSVDKTILIIEHRFEEVLHRSIDRVILMDEGSIVADMTPDALISSNLLQKYGIREPLYISALKKMYGGLHQTDNLTSLDTIDLSVYEGIDFKRHDKTHENIHGEPIITFENVEFGYDKPFINIPSLTFYQGERVAIVGENGSGKTTLARLITGVITPQTGFIKRHGDPLTIKEIGTLVGYVMQNPNQMLIANTLYEEVAFALKLQGLGDEEIEARVKESLEITGLYMKRNWPNTVLSYGQKKRLTVAIILALRPSCIILDEPTAGQDYAHYREMMEFVYKLNQDMGISLIFITHDMHLALEYTTRCIVMQQGHILAEGPTYDILDNKEWIDKASLRETSIFTFAKKMNLDTQDFLNHFIQFEKEEANDE